MAGNECGGWEHYIQHNAVDHQVQHLVDFLTNVPIYSVWDIASRVAHVYFYRGIHQKW